MRELNKAWFGRWCRKIAAGVVFGISGTAIAAASSAQAFEPESTEPIKIAQHDWAGSEFSAQLLASILSEVGYNVEVVNIDPSSVYTALENGDITFQVESWSSSHPEMFEIVESGKVTNVGESGLVGMDRWWFPEYVKEECPGLPDYKALNDCAKLFATPETGDKGRLLVYPEAWGGNDEERVKALGLNYEVVHVGSEAALLAEVKAATQRKQPVLAWLYEPHWAPVEYKGEYVELPAYSDECYESESYACEKPQGPIYKLAWPGAKDKWPHAYEIFEAFKLGNQEYGAALVDISLKDESVSDAVAGWMDENKDRWTKWTE